MFKNMFKRSWLSIARKPSRAIILCLLLFAMANLVLASIAIKSAVNESMSYAKSSLGGTVYLKPDLEKLRQKAENESEQKTSTGQLAMRPTVLPALDQSVVNKIGSSSYVKDYSYSINARAQASGFEPVKNEAIGEVMGFGVNKETGLESNVSVEGINDHLFLKQVKDGSITMSSGNYFDENTSNQVIISYNLASANGLKVGDDIALQNVYTKDVISFKIAGIYDLSEEDAFGIASNTIYMNTKSASQLLSLEEYNDGNFSVMDIEYYMKSAENTEAFITEANGKYTALSDDGFVLSIDDAAYKRMVGPIESVGGFATTILWVVVIASVAIVSLIVTINVKDRRYEMGVLLSLGASKRNVVGQIFIELIIVGTLAFVVSLGTSALFAKSMSQGLLDSQIAASKQQSESSFGRTNTAPGGVVGIGGPSNSSSGVESIDTIDVSVRVNDYLTLFVIGYAIILLSLALPSWNIVKYQPKTILSGKE